MTSPLVSALDVPAVGADPTPTTTAPPIQKRDLILPQQYFTTVSSARGSNSTTPVGEKSQKQNLTIDELCSLVRE